jgi:hypothetical protein
VISCRERRGEKKKRREEIGQKENRNEYGRTGGEVRNVGRTAGWGEKERGEKQHARK